MSVTIPLPPSSPTEDRAPESLAAGASPRLRADLEALLGAERVLGRAIDLVRYASDASPYRLIPQVVVMAHDAADVARVFTYAREHAIPVTLRGGGTSLNGQGQSAGILVDVRRHFQGVRLLDGGARVRVRPGTVLGHVNRVLRRHSRRMGPDPASTDIATVGGVIANNSGGMRCGTVHDSYRLLRSATIVLASGHSFDTSAPGAGERFAQLEPELAGGLAEIRDALRADEELAARVRRKFEIKNTTGYRLCAFLDADDPLEILLKLMVGSEGTLGFVSEAVMDTVPHGRHTATGMLFFADIDAAAAPVGELVEAGASAVELMVNPTLIAAAYSLPGMPESWRELDPGGAVLLVELRCEEEADLDRLERAARDALASHAVAQEAVFTRDAEETERFWRVREGMHGIVGAMRPQGSALIIEDVCVPPARIAEAARDIRELLGRHGFIPGVAGHASAGNLHFMLTPDFTQPADLERYEAFMGELVALIVDRYDGSLKAEHGTGRNMAPYVEREWGERATELMWRIKRLADPAGVLGPDVVLSRDAGIHLRDLRSTPPIEDAGHANRCMECGFCEPVCPSRSLTTTPRQRIVVRREMARQPEGSELRRVLAEEFDYDGAQTCAADGSCQLACPVNIDTGKLIKSVRVRANGPRAERAGNALARRWATVERAARAGLRAGHLAGDRPTAFALGVARRLAGPERLPGWSAALPAPAPSGLPPTRRAGAAAVYLPACSNRILGPPASEPWVVSSFVALSERAGLPVWIPGDVAGVCCGTPWASKGLAAGHATAARGLAEALWRWSEGGALPVVMDAASCTLGATTDLPEDLDESDRERLAGVQIIDAVRWTRERLLDALPPARRLEAVAVHPTCSARHLGLDADLAALTAAVADRVVVAPSAFCCGYAGDRGLLHPELTAAATRPEAAELEDEEVQARVSCNRTCEIGLEQGTGRVWTSILATLEQATRP